MQNKINKKGFTLAELMVAIAIIGILATVVMVSLNGGRQRAKSTKALSALESAAKLAEICLVRGETVSTPTIGSANPGNKICSETVAAYPDLTGTNFTYTNFSNPGSNLQFGIGASTPGGAQQIVCGANLNLNGFFASHPGADYNFVGKSASCVTYGF